MDGIVGQIDKQERKRITERIKDHDSGQVTIHDAKDRPAHEWTKFGRPSRDKRRAYPREVSLGRSVLGFSSGQSAGEYVIREIVKRQEFELAQGATVLHVKDGKPLTEHGAKMLGVQWPIECTTAPNS
jgi:hypothetical protein